MTPGSNGTGIDYPTIELGGKMYTVKFTRGALLYRLSKSGSRLSDLQTNKNISTLIDCLHAGLYGQYDGSAEDLAELIYSEDAKIIQVDQAVSEALKKVFPSSPSAAKSAGVEAQAS